MAGARRGRVLTAGSAALVTVVLGLTACAGSPPPLQYEDHGLAVCSETSYGEFGAGIMLDHADGGPITIEGVTSSRRDGLRIIGTLVVDVPHDRIGGVAWPIASSWHGRRAVGAVVRAGDPVDLVVGVRPTSPAGGSLGSISVRYRAGGEQYTVDTHVHVSMRQHC